MPSPPAERAPAPEEAPEDPPVGAVEHPGLAAFPSGIGLLSGWVGEADVVEVEITGLARTSWLKAFSLKGFDIISERDFIIGPTPIILSHNRWHALLHHLPPMIDGDAFFDRSGPALRTSGMSAPEVGVQQPQPGPGSIESRGLRFTSCHIAWLLSTVRPPEAVGLRCANPTYDSRARMCPHTPAVSSTVKKELTSRASAEKFSRRIAPRGPRSIRVSSSCCLIVTAGKYTF